MIFEHCVGGNIGVSPIFFLSLSDVQLWLWLKVAAFRLSADAGETPALAGPAVHPQYLKIKVMSTGSTYNILRSEWYCQWHCDSLSSNDWHSGWHITMAAVHSFSQRSESDSESLQRRILNGGLGGA